MADKDELGRRGETMAAAWLETQGYLILDRNVRLRRGEIDLVAREKGELVLVEVKTRTTDAFGSPAESITSTKAKRMARAAQEYLKSCGESTARCDVVAILLPKTGEPQFELFKNAVALGDWLDSDAS